MTSLSDSELDLSSHHSLLTVDLWGRHAACYSGAFRSLLSSHCPAVSLSSEPLKSSYSSFPSCHIEGISHGDRHRERRGRCCSSHRSIRRGRDGRGDVVDSTWLLRCLRVRSSTFSYVVKFSNQRLSSSFPTEILYRSRTSRAISSNPSFNTSLAPRRRFFFRSKL